MCLAHSVGNMVIQSYNHSERMQERRELMQFWADYIDKLAHENNITTSPIKTTYSKSIYNTCKI